MRSPCPTNKEQPSLIRDQHRVVLSAVVSWSLNHWTTSKIPLTLLYIFEGSEKGYDTELKEQGAGLSIGQRQLIAFARTMISMPKILILDEATSSIDTHTEILVQKGIEALLAGRTSFVIAHRLSTIQNADRIFVIDQGGILEQGSPKELMERQGAYYKLYMAQFADVQ